MSDDSTWLRSAPPTSIVGRTVTLRRWADDDVDEQLAAIRESADALVRWMPWADGYRRIDGERFIARMHTAWVEHTEFGYALVDPAGGLLGSMGLHVRIGVGGIEIGYWIRSSAQRRGLTTRAAALATAAALALDDVTHTEIRHDRANEVSGRIPRRLGYRHVATVTREPDAPAASGIALHWRMSVAQFPGSAAARFVADEARR